MTDYLLTKGFTSGRPYGITNIVIHHMAGVLTAEACGKILANRGVSAHYGIGNDGSVGKYVNESDRAWACGDGIGVNSTGNDKGISIEVSNSATGGEWPVGDVAFEKLIELAKDVATRNSLLPLTVGVNLYGHRDFKATTCPGSLYARLQEIADKVNEGTPNPGPAPTPTPEPSKPSVAKKTYGMKYTNTDAYIGKVAEFMYKTFPAYTNKKALGNYFGPYLTATIKEFQKRTGLIVDGNFAENGETIKKLREYGFKG